MCEVGDAPKYGNSNGFPGASPDSNSDWRHSLELSLLIDYQKPLGTSVKWPET